jgi:hypothetical protein
MFGVRCPPARFANFALAHDADTPIFTHAGRVYRIPDAIAPEVWAYLDHREKDGYTLRTEDVYSLKDGEEVVVEKDVSAHRLHDPARLQPLSGATTPPGTPKSQ